MVILQPEYQLTNDINPLNPAIAFYTYTDKAELISFCQYKDIISIKLDKAFKDIGNITVEILDEALAYDILTEFESLPIIIEYLHTGTRLRKKNKLYMLQSAQASNYIDDSTGQEVIKYTFVGMDFYNDMSHTYLANNRFSDPSTWAVDDQGQKIQPDDYGMFQATTDQNVDEFTIFGWMIGDAFVKGHVYEPTLEREVESQKIPNFSIGKPVNNPDNRKIANKKCGSDTTILSYLKERYWYFYEHLQILEDGSLKFFIEDGTEIVNFDFAHTRDVPQLFNYNIDVKDMAHLMLTNRQNGEGSVRQFYYGNSASTNPRNTLTQYQMFCDVQSSDSTEIKDAQNELQKNHDNYVNFELEMLFSDYEPFTDYEIGQLVKFTNLEPLLNGRTFIVSKIEQSIQGNEKNTTVTIEDVTGKQETKDVPRIRTIETKLLNKLRNTKGER